jgi:hemolysin III
MEKPKLRGIVHLVMSPISLVAGLVLITLADELRGRITLGIFTSNRSYLIYLQRSCTIESAWTPKNKAIWRRIDHSKYCQY